MLLAGCGSGIVTPVAPAGNALAGNWLIVGPMPTTATIATTASTASTGFRLALTFDVTGSIIEAAGFGNDSCGDAEGSFAFGSLATGTIAADGSFTLKTPSSFSDDEVISIQGTVPKANGNPWPGSYTASFPGSLVGSTCSSNLAGNFTATSFPLVGGVYVGTGSSQAMVNGVLTTTPLTFQVTLQQGGTVVSSVTGKPLTSNAVLVGSISVQGSPCFTSGVTGSTPTSEVEGNQVVATFTMDDGSKLNIAGTLTDATEMRITTNIAIVTGGQCGATQRIYQLPELDRQS